MRGNDSIVALEIKIKTLIADHKRLKSLLHEAATQIRNLEEENREIKEQSRKIEKENSRLQLIEALAAGSKSDELAREKARNRVNRLLREVDKCINLLTSESTNS